MTKSEIKINDRLDLREKMYGRGSVDSLTDMAGVGERRLFFTVLKMAEAGKLELVSTQYQSRIRNYRTNETENFTVIKFKRSKQMTENTRCDIVSIFRTTGIKYIVLKNGVEASVDYLTKEEAESKRLELTREVK